MVKMGFLTVSGILVLWTGLTSATLKCGFDVGESCTWFNATTNRQFTWRRSSRLSASGQYLYAAGSNSGHIANVAKLFSGLQLPDRTGFLCMRFRYRMSGLSVGTLRVLDDNANELWSKSGNQGRHWHSAAVSVPAAGPFEVTLAAENKYNVGVHQISIDEITEEAGKCKSPSLNTCGINLKGLGCYSDVAADRTLPRLLVNFRDDGSDGTLISWSHFGASVTNLLCECAQLAKEAGYKYFGLQFYGECWSGPGELRYNKYGNSKKCIDGNFKSKNCTSPNGNRCTGQELANYVYQII